MLNRLEFFDSVSGIQYPEMLVNFFDQFIALKQLVEGNGKVGVISSSNKDITFQIIFNNKENKDYALAIISSLGGNIVIYNKPIVVKVDIITEQSININLT